MIHEEMTDEMLFTLIPELRPMAGFAQNNPYHIYDVWEHTMKALDAAGDDLIVRLAVLFHDIGKPGCYSADEQGIGHFYGHAAVGAGITRRILERLEVEEDIREKVVELVHYHDLDLHARHKSVEKWLARLGEEQFVRLLEVERCDIAGQNPDYRETRLDKLDRLETILGEVLEKTGRFRVRDLKVSGYDLMQLGYQPGRRLRTSLQMLADSVEAGETANDREALLAAASTALCKIR